MSRHFQRREFACPHCGVALVRPALTAALEQLRERRGGRPIVIVSGYRCPPHNLAVGGAPDSQHMYASAADLHAGVATVDEAAACGFIGIGSSGTWAVHVDVRDGAPARWTYAH